MANKTDFLALGNGSTDCVVPHFHQDIKIIAPTPISYPGKHKKGHVDRLLFWIAAVWPMLITDDLESQLGK